MMPLKRSWVLILAALILALSSANAKVNANQLQNPIPSPSKSSKPPQEQPTASAQQANPYQPQPNLPQIIINVVPPQKTKEESDREAKAQEDKASSDWWMTIFNGLLVVFTAILVIVGTWQGHQNRKSANAARDANEIAKASLQIIQRARIVVSHRGELLKIGEKPKATLGIHNIGSTPAYVIRVETWGAIFNYPYEDFPVNSKIEDTTGTIIHPQSFHDTLIDIELPNALTSEDLAHITQGTKHFCFRILIKYRDAFGNDWHTDHGIGIGKGRPWPMSGYSTST
ncbi:MAG: hypothetical protein HOP35_04070 [Nitrospira sp.]|nr:hypothetical protein [Nitrospira sp.]